MSNEEEEGTADGVSLSPLLHRGAPAPASTVTTSAMTTTSLAPSQQQQQQASTMTMPSPPSSSTPSIVALAVAPAPPPDNVIVKSPTATTSTSRASSRAPSPTVSDLSDELPSNVSTYEQLETLPIECLNPEIDSKQQRPLRHVDELDQVTCYSLKPMWYSVIFILLVELLERFAFYGINYTQTSYLTGAYDDNWNAGMDAVPASSYVSISTAVAYTTPFLGALFSDSLLGDYWSILVGSLVFYLPGLFLIAFTTVPGLLGKEFNRSALAVGLLFLWPVGTGVVKSVVNVFGARQFHPLLQSSLIEVYYIKFYMCINIGALVGGIVVPLLAQHNVTWAYFLPVVMLSMGVLLFVSGSPRYVKSQPKEKFVLCSRKTVPRRAFSESSNNNNNNIGLSVIMRISLLIVPFCIAYSQMATTFIVQGTVMKKAFGFIDAASMNNADAISVLVFGSLVGTQFYPWLARRGIKIPTTYKFAIGSALGALAIAWALVVERKIHYTYYTSGEQVSILWQAWSYFLIGAGEIFAVSAAYEVAFTASPPEKKVLASAVNLFCIGGLPNVICIMLYHACRPWFENRRGTTHITRLPDYASAHVGRYFWVLFVISVAGVLMNLLPSVRAFVESIEDKATDMIKSPKTPTRPPRREGALDEESPLLRAKRHQAYLKYGSGPVLYKSGSMRAGPTVSQRHLLSERHLKRSQIPKLYRSDPILPGVGTVITGSKGKPIMAGTLMKKQPPIQRREPKLKRSTSG